MKKRCDWCVGDELYERYHDDEWGKPVYDDKILFEFLVLEGAQAGLSWITVLRKRENYRKAFDNFDYEKIANYDDKKVLELLQNDGIIRNRLKINSVIKNAKVFMEIQNEFGSFSDYIWRFTDGKPIVNHFKSLAEVPSKTELSDKISRDLKKRGMSFVGSTIMYAYMQATGMVNDHLLDCFCYKELLNN